MAKQWFFVELTKDTDPNDHASGAYQADSAFEAEKIAEVAYLGYSAVSSRVD